MLEHIYKISGKYPDPYQIERHLDSLRNKSDSELEYKKSLAEIKSSGLSSHPLLRRFFVES